MIANPATHFASKKHFLCLNCQYTFDVLLGF